MRPYLILTFALTAIFCPAVSAQTVEKVYFNDGKSIEGYISEQIPGEEISVTTENGTEKYMWNNIVKTKKLFRDNSDFGIKERITLSSGTVLEGRISEQNIGRNIIIETANGGHKVIGLDDIVSIDSESVSDSIPLWEQIVFLDRLILRDSTVIDGFIVSRRLGESVSILQQNRFKPDVIPLSEIAVYQKIKNTDYLMNDDHVTVEINEHAVQLAKCEIVDDIIVKIRQSETPELLAGRPVTVNVNDLKINNTVRLYKVAPDTGKKTEGFKSGYVFDLTDYPDQEICPDPENPAQITFSVKRQGYYFLALKDFEIGVVLEFCK